MSGSDQVNSGPSGVKRAPGKKLRTVVRPLVIGGRSIAAGERLRLDLPVADLYTHTQLTMPIEVVRGKTDGPVMFVSAAVHGDEINGVEIVRRVLAAASLKRLKGTLIAVPIVNVHGFLAHSRYLPDRRDLNRSFPGSARGSVAGRLAHLFATEIVAKADCGIDLHTAAIHRDNMPQIRANLKDEHTLRLAEAFHAPIMLNADLRDGSLRAHAGDLGIPMLLFEAGEALRFDEGSIRVGVRGVLNVMRELGMLTKRAPSSSTSSKKKAPAKQIVRASSSSWARAEQSGILRSAVELGQSVAKGDVLGVISDPFGNDEMPVTTKIEGVLIGRTNLPLVNEGDALFHIAMTEDQEPSLELGTREEILAATDNWELPPSGPPII
jgi:predicted deacylase